MAWGMGESQRTGCIIYENRRRYRAFSNIYNQKLTVAIIKIVSEISNPSALRFEEHPLFRLSNGMGSFWSGGCKNKILWLTFHNFEWAASAKRFSEPPARFLVYVKRPPAEILKPIWPRSWHKSINSINP